MVLGKKSIVSFGSRVTASNQVEVKWYISYQSNRVSLLVLLFKIVYDIASLLALLLLDFHSHCFLQAEFHKRESHLHGIEVAIHLVENDWTVHASVVSCLESDIYLKYKKNVIIWGLFEVTPLTTRLIEQPSGFIMSCTHEIEALPNKISKLGF